MTKDQERDLENSRRRKAYDRLKRIRLIQASAFILIILALLTVVVGGPLYVACHFIAKFW